MFLGEDLKVADCFGLIKANTVSNEVKCEEHDINKLKIKGKTVIILCGNNTKNSNRASEYANYCLDWLNKLEQRDQVSVYSIYYPKSQPLLNNFTPNLFFDYDGLAEVIFKQVIYKNNEVLSVDEIANNLNDIVFFGHSIGGYVMNELMNKFGAMLEKENFTKTQINKIYSRVAFIGYSPFAVVKAPINNIYITPIYDSLGSLKFALDEVKNKKNVSFSNGQLNIGMICKEASKTPHLFRKAYRTSIDNQDIAYLMHKNTLIATPNLLFADGKKEDHNLAGVIKYQEKNPYKTSAGETTTKLLEYVLKYSLLTERQNFSISELYNNLTKNAQHTLNEIETREL